MWPTRWPTGCEGGNYVAVLSDAKARNIKPDDKPFAHGAVTGLILVPSATKGRGKWVLRFVSPITKKRRKAGLGTYPEIGIAAATRLGTAMREQIAAGLDPLVEKLSIANSPKIPDFQCAAQIVHQQLLPGWKNKKHGQQWINTITEYALPLIGKVALDQIQPKHIAEVLRPIWLTKAETASRLRQRIHTVMAWGWAHGYCTANPVDVVNHLLPQQPSKVLREQHHPAMPWRDIPAFISKYLKYNDGIDVVRLMMQFLILTAARSAEVRGMRWCEVDFYKAVWTVPSERMKVKQIHRVPLAPQAIEILHRLSGLHDELVFPSPRVQNVLSDMALTSFLRRIKIPSSIEGRIATAHGFRSSFRDWCSEHGYARDLAERALAHSVANKVEAAYHRTDLLEQRRPMMQAWADFIYKEAGGLIETN